MRPVAVAYLASFLLSTLGNGIAAVALPLIVLQTTGSPLAAGTASLATAVPAVAVGLVAGMLLDRMNRRTCSVVSDVISAVTVAAIPLVDVVWGLNLGWFVLLGILGSFGDVPGMTAREVLLPAVVRHSGVSLERMIGLREALGSVAIIVGPAAAGTLMTLFEGSTVLLITAATSAAAALLTLAIPHRAGAVGDGGPAAPEPITAQLVAGWQVLRRSRVLLGSVGLGLGAVVVIGGLQGLVLPLYFTLIERPGLLGFVLTALAAGSLLGAVAFAAVGPRASRRTLLYGGLVGTTIGFALVAALPSPWVVFAGAFVAGAASGLMSGVLGVVVVEATPDAVRGRVLAIQNAAMMVAAPAGIGLASVVAEYGSPVAAGLTVTAVWAVAVTVVVWSRALTPAGREPGAAGSATGVGPTPADAHGAPATPSTGASRSA